MSKRQPYNFKPAPSGAKPIWTSLHAKADPAGHQKRAEAEFPHGASPEQDPDALRVGRRSFLTVAGATSALLSLEACIRRPKEKILPFVKQPEYIVPGVALHYATTVSSGGEALGLLVETHEGRPTKVEGNPAHPASLGATDGHAQSMILDLYDPDRSRGPARAVASSEMGKFTEASFEELDVALDGVAEEANADGGAGLRVLVQPSQSLSLQHAASAFRSRFPKAKVYAYQAAGAENIAAGARAAYGQAVQPVVNYDRARTVVALDADFLGSEPGSVLAARQFAKGRRVTSPGDGMSRLYVVEPGYSITGAAADHRLRLKAGAVGAYAKALAAELARQGVDLGAVKPTVSSAAAPADVPAAWIKAVAAELVASRGKGVLVAGARQPSSVHALVSAMNEALGNVGAEGTVSLYATGGVVSASQTADIEALAAEIKAGTVKSLLVLGGNPAYDAPADLGFAKLLKSVQWSLHLASHRNETGRHTRWHAPEAHPFECWGDHVSRTGALGLQQPMIAPLHGGRSAAEILAKLGGVKWWRGHPLVRATMRKVLAQGDFEASWKSALQSGIVRDGDAVNATLNAAGVAIAAGAIGAADGGSPAAVEVDFSPDPALGDGRSGNNPWMLELPHPLSCISWDNAAYFSAKTASELGVKNEDLVLIKDGQGNPAEVVAWVLPGQADGSVSVHLGWGRPAAGQYGAGVGFDLYPLRTTRTMGFSSGCSVELVGRKHDVVQTQETHSMEGRPVAVDATLEEYRKNPDFAEDASPTFSAMPLWKEVDYSKGHKWGMTIDLSTCSGCNACLVACQSENNVATVGKEQVGRGRDMYWQRLDRYFVGADEANPGVAFQPVACVQCEEAPCENVCPVAATAHSPEGLNDMAYNRCIGTRYCMNNCPYKVRRFNFLDYTGKVPEVRRMQYNPNVTVRMRGTMEKCSYCVQRIQEARISARRDERPLKGESVVMACQQACSSGAIVFGDLNDKDSEVYKLSKLDRSYKLLAGVGTQPRTTYLGKIRNPNPEMQA